MTPDSHTLMLVQAHKLALDNFVLELLRWLVGFAVIQASMLGPNILKTVIV